MSRPPYDSADDAWASSAFVRGIARGRPLPANEEAEQEVLRSILNDNTRIEPLAAIVTAEDFSVAANGRIFAACLRMRDTDRRAEPMTLGREIGADSDLVALGGARYLALLHDGFPVSDGGDEAARQVHDLAVKRRLIQAASEIAESAWNETADLDAAERVEAAESLVAGLSAAQGGKRSPRRLSEVIDSMHDHIGRMMDGSIKFVSTGLKSLDDQLGGLMPGDVCVIAGRPGMGKSLMSRTIAANVARDGEPVLLFSQEMSAIQVGMGFAQQVTAFDTARMRRGDLTRDQFAELSRFTYGIKGLPIWIDDTSALTVEAMRRKCREVRREAGRLPLVIIDYLQLMAGPERLELNVTQKTEYISRQIKVMAGEEQFATVLLSQLSRAVESRDNRRPGLSDLRNSGAIEQDADSVALLFREEYYLQQQMPTGEAARNRGAFEEWECKLDECRGVAEAIVAKNRFGTTGVVKLHFNGARGLFEDPAGARMNGHRYAPVDDVDDGF